MSLIELELETRHCPVVHFYPHPRPRHRHISGPDSRSAKTATARRTATARDRRGGEVVLVVVVGMKTSSVRGASCELCGGEIELGSEIWPIEPPPAPSDAPAPRPSKPKPKGFWWVHVPCARERAGGELVAPACRRWLKYGRCDFGDSCFYRHPLMAEQAAAAATGADDEAGVTSVAAGTAEKPGHGWARLGVGGSSGTGAKGPAVTKRRKRPRNASKCSTLRRFLYDHFGGAEGLRKGTGTAPPPAFAGLSVPLAF